MPTKRDHEPKKSISPWIIIAVIVFLVALGFSATLQPTVEQRGGECWQGMQLGSDHLC